MVKLDEKWKKNGKPNPRKDEKEPKHPRDPLQRAKLGLVVFPCQKNDSEFVVGVFIGEKRVKIRPKSSVPPLGGLSVPPGGLAKASKPHGGVRCRSMVSLTTA